MTELIEPHTNIEKISMMLSGKLNDNFLQIHFNEPDNMT